MSAIVLIPRWTPPFVAVGASFTVLTCTGSLGAGTHALFHEIHRLRSASLLLHVAARAHMLHCGATAGGPAGDEGRSSRAAVLVDVLALEHQPLRNKRVDVRSPGLFVAPPAKVEVPHCMRAQRCTSTRLMVLFMQRTHHHHHRHCHLKGGEPGKNPGWSFEAKQVVCARAPSSTRLKIRCGLKPSAGGGGGPGGGTGGCGR